MRYDGSILCEVFRLSYNARPDRYYHLPCIFAASMWEFLVGIPCYGERKNTGAYGFRYTRFI